ncbi:hypothetical protein ES703_68927 [subsurface metagenome]
MFWLRIGIGFDQQETPVGMLGMAGPYLLPVDYEIIAILYRSGSQRGQVGTGSGLAPALTPQYIPAGDAGQKALLLLLGAVGHQGRSQHADPAEVQARSAQVIHLLVEDDALHVSILSSVLLGPGHAQPPFGRQFLGHPSGELPFIFTLHKPADPGLQARGHFPGDEVPYLLPKLLLIRAKAEIHPLTSLVNLSSVLKRFKV